jgi:hypothetical protein
VSLPQNYTKEEFEAVIKIVVVVWNAVVVDSWEKNNKFETELLKTMELTSKQGLVEVKRLIKRKVTIQCTVPPFEEGELGGIL